MLQNFLRRLFEKKSYSLEIVTDQGTATTLKFMTIEKLVICLCEICEFVHPATIHYAGEVAYGKYIAWNGRSPEKNYQEEFYLTDKAVRMLAGPKNLIDYCLALYGPDPRGRPALKLNGRQENYFRTTDIDYWHGDRTYAISEKRLNEYLDKLEMSRQARRAHQENPDLAYEIPE